MTALLETRALSKYFPVRRGLLQRAKGFVRALECVDLTLREGEFFALVGESGGGKTTFGRCVVRLLEPTAGCVHFRGENLATLSGRELRRRRRHFQMIFQDPYGSLNPRMRIERILSEPLEVHRTVPRAERPGRVQELLQLVGMPADAARRFPHEFSGGQRQRIGIARALAPEPSFVVADEPVSALDVSVRAQIINLLVDLQRRFRLTLLFIAHDLAMVEQTADRVGVMYLGRFVEIGPTTALFSSPQHPYTVSLLSAVPVPEPATGRSRILLPGEPPSPLEPPSGCPFHPRCPIARPRCATDEPPLAEIAPGHRVACHYPGELETGWTAGPAAPGSGSGTF
ncbi:MAG: ABC transporter ATP-binding protein [Thermoanaerobaculia bacterium]